ncbi:hypothetical protein [Sorangium sp. So ce388]|uniref:hypothetical protein n=1 Tax=Sorangium sp. So ce388 TaxID=3133309 RepID=UPI003F5C465F
MLQNAKDALCFMCETTPGRWNDPAIAVDPGQAYAEMEALVRRLVELKNGRTTPEELQSHMLQMCAMCQEIVMDVGEGVSREEIVSRIEFRITRLYQLGEAHSRATA